MAMSKMAQKTPEVLDTINWKEFKKAKEAVKLSVDLSNLIGKKF